MLAARINSLNLSPASEPAHAGPERDRCPAQIDRSLNPGGRLLPVPWNPPALGSRPLPMSATSATLANTPPPPYLAVIFTSLRTEGDQGYGEMSARMVEAGSKHPGFLGIESARGADGLGITVSYWKDEESIRRWKADMEHRVAQAKGKATWYSRYEVRIAKVERAYGFPRAGADLES